MVGRVKSGFIDTWLIDRNKEDNYVVISLSLVTSLVVFFLSWLQRTVKNDWAALLSPNCTVLEKGYMTQSLPCSLVQGIMTFNSFLALYVFSASVIRPTLNYIVSPSIFFWLFSPAVLSF